MEHGFGLDIPRTLEQVCDPKRMGLLVYDMQVGIVDQLPDGPEGRTVAPGGAGEGFPVFFSRHMSLPKELMGVFQLSNALAFRD